jgi:hypothetical protein
VDRTVFALGPADDQVHPLAGQPERLFGQKLGRRNLDVVRRAGRALDAHEVLGQVLVPDVVLDISFFMACYPLANLRDLEDVDEGVLVNLNLVHSAFAI